MVFDNAFTQVHAALANGVSCGGIISYFDFDLKTINWIKLGLSFNTPLNSSATFNARLPIHLLFETNRLIEVVNYMIEGFNIEFSDNDDPSELDWDFDFYKFPTVGEIKRRLQSVNGGGFPFDAFFSNYADRVSGKRLHYSQAHHPFFSTPMYLEHKKKLPDPYHEQIWAIAQNPYLFFRALFEDAPYFAECVIAQTFWLDNWANARDSLGIFS